MVETCCCGCCHVETGSLIIAVLNIIGGISTIVRNGFTVAVMINSPDSIDEKQYPSFKDYQAGYITSQFIGMILALVYFALSVYLFIGIREKNYKKIMPWLYWNYFGLVLLGIFTIVISIVMAIFVNVLLGIFLFIFLVIALAINYYFINVVQRHVSELKAA